MNGRRFERAGVRWGRLVPLLVSLGLTLLPEVAAAAPFDPQVATDEYLATVSGEARARSDAYFEGGYWIDLWGFLIGTAVYLGMLQSRLSARLRNVAERLFQRRAARVATYFLFYLAFTTVVMFPWSVYTDFVREHRYELATQDFGAWMGDRIKGFALVAVFGSLAVVALYAVLRRATKTWWLWGAGLAVSFSLVGMSIAPVFISPLFNEYTPLADGPIETAVLRMAQANGMHAEEVWMSDASAQSTRISANVSGMFGTERITLNDNLLNGCSQAEVEAVMGHEIGHYVLNHVYEGMLFFSVVIVVGFAFVRFGVERGLARWGPRWGVRGVDDPAGLPLLVWLFSVYGLLLTPVTNSYVRANEAEADIFGLNAARQPDGFATTALKLGTYRKLDPGPWEELLFFDHPSGRSRIEMAMEWKAVHQPVDADDRDEDRPKPAPTP